MHPTRIFKTPEELEKVWNEYKADLKEKGKQWEKIQYVGKDGKKATDYPKLPYTLEGLKCFCWEKKIGTIEQYFKNQDALYDDFIHICSRIKEEIRNDQITGGMLGFYNPSITQRLNNLKEQSEVSSTHNIQLLNIDPLADTETDA
jgi:hypothetical protein